jgi:hypothetical protein
MFVAIRKDSSRVRSFDRDQCRKMSGDYRWHTRALRGGRSWPSLTMRLRSRPPAPRRWARARQFAAGIWEYFKSWAEIFRQSVGASGKKLTQRLRPAMPPIFALASAVLCEIALAGWGGRIRTLGSREAASRTWLERNGGAIGAPYSLQNGPMDWTGVQVTLWQLSRQKSLIAKRSEMKGNSGHTSKANFGSAFVSPNPPTPASQCGLHYAISACVRTAVIPAG